MGWARVNILARRTPVSKEYIMHFPKFRTDTFDKKDAFTIQPTQLLNSYQYHLGT